MWSCFVGVLLVVREGAGVFAVLATLLAASNHARAPRDIQELANGPYSLFRCCAVQA